LIVCMLGAKDHVESLASVGTGSFDSLVSIPRMWLESDYALVKQKVVVGPSILLAIHAL